MHPQNDGASHSRGQAQRATRTGTKGDAPSQRTKASHRARAQRTERNAPRQRPESTSRGTSRQRVIYYSSCSALLVSVHITRFRASLLALPRFFARASALLCSRCRASLLALPRFFAHIAASSSPPGDKKNIKRVLCPTEYSTTIGFLMTVPSAGYSCGANLRVTLSADTRLMNMAR